MKIELLGNKESENKHIKSINNNKKYFIINNKSFEGNGLTIKENYFLLLLYKHRDIMDNIASPEERYLLEFLGCSKRSLRKYSKKLSEKGLINKKVKRGKPNEYKLLKVKSGGFTVIPNNYVGVNKNNMHYEITYLYLKILSEKDNIVNTSYKELRELVKCGNNKLLTVLKSLEKDLLINRLMWNQYNTYKVEVGDTMESNNYGKFRVIEFIRANKNGVKFYKIKFLKTGFESVVGRNSLISGSVKDYTQPTICGKGFIGAKNMKKDHPRKYRLWLSIINRCYNKDNVSYRYYGDKGVTVDNKWFNFVRFVKDIPRVEGYNKEDFQNGNLELDKDIKQRSVPKDKMVYSLSTCKFVSQEENLNERFRD